MNQKIGWKKRAVSFFLMLSMMLVLWPSTVVGGVEADYDLPWLWPVPGSFKLNSLDYYYGGGLHNSGQCIDIGNNGYSGANRLDVISATTGKVLYIQNKYDETTNRGSGWGNYVIVRSGNVNIVYGHLQTVTCTYGTIKAGDVIGKMGNTGNSTGVHLHLQAYPVGQNSSDASIKVFEQFRTNPLYYEKFQFMKGLKTHSKAYGEWIAQYYTNASGSYYMYSGGLDIDYTITPSAASVTVINTTGAILRSLPIYENAYNVDTLKYGDVVKIVGHYTDGYGTAWLLISDEANERTWLLADDVGFRDYNFETTLVDAVSPEGTLGSLWDMAFSGTIVSKNVVESFTAKLMKGDKTVATYTETVGCPAYTITDTIKMGFGETKLTDGTYTYVLTAVERATYPGVDAVVREKTLATSTFTINTSLSDRVPPLLEAIHVIAMTPSSVTLSVIASDNKRMDRVEVNVSTSDESFAKTYTAEATDDAYRVTIPVTDLKGTGSYTVTATAYDSYGNADERSRVITIPSGNLSETWEVLEALRVRSGPGTGYDRLYTLKTGNVVTITEVYDDGSYLWGNVGDGWCAINYCSYESGYLYEIYFDLNGGTADGFDPIGKRYGQSVTLPKTVPVREGYTFLGWAYRSDAKTPDVKAGGTITENASVTLFAVWGDSTVPSLVSVTKDPNGWTNDSVTLTVHATDNTGIVYYSFDGGMSWMAEGKLVVTENTRFPSGTIAVKDPSGNITYLNEEYVVDTIDKLAPDMSGAKITVSTEAGKATLTATGIVDEQSGLSAYELILSSSRDFSNPTIVSVVPGTPFSLGDGLYYGKLRVTDGAGNTAVTEFARFRVGDATALSAPVGVGIFKTTSESVEVRWDAVENADVYTLMLSKTPDFTEGLIEMATTSASAIVTGLVAGETYFARVVATASDRVFLPSQPSHVVSFVTLNDDNTLHSFLEMTDAIMDHETNIVQWIAPYGANVLNFTATVDETAAIRYWYDEDMTGEMLGLAIGAFPFTADTAQVYLQITAENGESRLYTVVVTRADAVAETPIVDFDGEDQTVLIGETITLPSVIASVSDGGSLTVDWYMSYNGGTASLVGNGWEWTPVCDRAGKYEIYVVVTNENDKCQTTTATYTTDMMTVIVRKHSASISVLLSDYAYTGRVPSPAFSGYTGDGAVTYRFFTDAACQDPIEQPINAGVYYVVADAAETDRYLGVSSQVVRFEIKKLETDATPSLTVKQPSLRDPNGYVRVETDGVEYRVVGADTWEGVEKVELTFADPAELEFRLRETDNVAAGPVVKISLVPFAGADDFVPNGLMSLVVEGNYLIVNDSSVDAALLLNGLQKTAGVYLYASDGEKLNGTDRLVGTGATITIEDEIGIYKSLTVIVLGDLDGDGVVSRADAIHILELSNGMAISDSTYDLVAGDMDQDGVLTSADAYLAYLRV